MSVRQSDGLVEFAKAFLKAQTVIGKAVKDSTNPHFKKSYASFESVMEAVEGPLHANGFGIIQRCDNDSSGATVRTMLLHVSGEFMEDSCFVPCARPNDPQALGSAITYARRYGLESIAGVVREDDDAEGAINRQPEPRLTEPPRQPARAPAHNPTTGEVVTVFPNYGKAKGMPIAGASFIDLSYYKNGAIKSLNDPAKARFHDQERALLSAIENELNAAQGHPNKDADVPF